MATFGYVRVSGINQNDDRQMIAMSEQGISPENVFADKQSGRDFDRPADMKSIGIGVKGMKEFTLSANGIYISPMVCRKNGSANADKAAPVNTGRMNKQAVVSGRECMLLPESKPEPAIFS